MEKNQEKKFGIIRRELVKLCDKVEKNLVPLHRALVSAAPMASDADVAARIDKLNAKLAMVNAAVHQLQTKRYERDGGASKRIATRLVADMSKVVKPQEGRPEKANAPRRPVFEGQSPSYPLTDALAFIESKRKSGCLQIQLEDETIVFGIADGSIVHTSTNRARRGERLGEILIEHGDATFGAMMSFIDAHRGQNDLLGMALVKGGIVTQDALTSALVEQLQRRFDRVFAAAKCAFAFFESKVATSTGLRFGIGEFLVESGHGTSLPVAAGTNPENIWENYGALPGKKYRGEPNDEWGTPETR